MKKSFLLFFVFLSGTQTQAMWVNCSRLAMRSARPTRQIHQLKIPVSRPVAKPRPKLFPATPTHLPVIKPPMRQLGTTQRVLDSSFKPKFMQTEEEKESAFAALSTVKDKEIVALVAKKNELEIVLVEQAKKVKQKANETQMEVSFVTGFTDSLFAGIAYLFGSERVNQKINEEVNLDLEFYQSLAEYEKTIIALHTAAICHKRGIKADEITPKERAMIKETAEQITTRLRRAAKRGGFTQEFISAFVGQALGEASRHILIEALKSAASAIIEIAKNLSD